MCRYSQVCSILSKIGTILGWYLINRSAKQRLCHGTFNKFVQSMNFVSKLSQSRRVVRKTLKFQQNLHIQIIHYCNLKEQSSYYSCSMSLQNQFVASYSITISQNYEIVPDNKPYLWALSELKLIFLLT